VRRKDVSWITDSLIEQETAFQNTLILNPVENIPKLDTLEPCSSWLHGLYNTDSLRDNEQKKSTKIQFAGRNSIAEDIDKIYADWATLLGAESLSMRLLSGLHAHIVVFMAIAKIGDRVLLLPEMAGGHMATHAILERLGLVVKEFVVDKQHLRVDKNQSLKLIKEFKPQFIFLDRSEGLIYEDFSWLNSIRDATKIFDASQYLTNIIANDYINPFDMGFDIIISTMHKNLPGPQRALVCSRRQDKTWGLLKNKMSTFVSNMHVFSIYSAGLLLGGLDELASLSANMLLNAMELEKELYNEGLPVTKRKVSEQEKPTHHVWVAIDDREKAFEFFLNLEKTGIFVNYRLLPYSLGYGIRMGLSAATYRGLDVPRISSLAKIIGGIYHAGYSIDLEAKFREVLNSFQK